MSNISFCVSMFQHTAARRRLDVFNVLFFPVLWVSTHSRPKAAGNQRRQCHLDSFCYNTQPPYGGWLFIAGYTLFSSSFNTQPPEGGWVLPWDS